MTVNFYKTFGKRNNSTKRPSITDTTLFTVHDCKLKQNCSEHDPVFILSSNEFGYIYAYSVDWHKFYYTVDVVSLANGLVEYHMSEDLLASYKTNIYNTTARIMYSSNGYDDLLIDSRIQVLNSKKRATKSPTVSDPVFNRPGGWYILSCLSNISATGVSTGFAANYIFSQSGIEKLRKWFSDTSFMSAIANYIKGEPLSSVFKVLWIPYDIPNADITGQSYCMIGDIYSSSPPYNITFDSGECGLISGHPFIYKSYSINLDRRYNDFRRAAPYTTGLLNLPGIGLVEVNYSDFGGSTSMDIMVTIEALTGNVKYDISVGGFSVQQASTNVAADCPIGQSVADGGGIMTGIGSILGGTAALAGAVATGGSGAVIAAAAGATIAGAANTILSSAKHAQTIAGNIGGRVAANAPYIYLEEYAVETEDPNDSNYILLQGRPYNGVAQIANLVPSPVAPIYVQCIDARVIPSILDSDFNTTTRPTIREQGEINDYLNSGVYIE